VPRLSGQDATILVLDCFTRNARAAIDALDSAYRVIGGSHRTDDLSLRRRFVGSRRLVNTFTYAHPDVDLAGFRDDVIAAVDRHEACAVVPAGTTITDALSRVKDEIEEATGSRLLVESHEKQVQLTDKWATIQLCRELDIPTPRSLLLRRLEDLAGVASRGELRFPLLIKPRQGSGSEGVRFFHSQAEVEQHLSSVGGDAQASRTDHYVAQEAIPGGGVGAGHLHDVTSCSLDGVPFCLLSQRRLLTARDFGGGGIMNVTTREDELLEYASRILRRLRWNGIAEFDFIQAADGRFFLLECNPKVWGTTWLTIQAGHNVVQWAVDTLVLGRSAPPAPLEYEDGLLCRWLFPDCVLYWASPPRTPVRILRRVRRTFSTFGARRSIYYVQPGYVLYALALLLRRLRGGGTAEPSR